MSKGVYGFIIFVLTALVFGMAGGTVYLRWQIENELEKCKKSYDVYQCVFEVVPVSAPAWVSK